MADGYMFGTLSKAQKDAVLKAVAVEAAKRFTTYVNALKSSLDFRVPGSKERLMLYRTRLPEVWEKLSIMNPALYNEQLIDWKRLEQRAAQRALSPFNPFNVSNTLASIANKSNVRLEE